jgi:Ni/Fe-hydrogenase subunit HybB-like protein
MLPLLFFLSAVGAGLSATILVALLAGWAFNRKVDMKVLGDLAKGSVWLWVVYLLFKLEHLWGTRQFDEAFAFDKFSIAYLTELGIGVILPIILYSISAVRKSKAGLLVTSLLVTAGVLLNRLNATLVGQEVTQSTWLVQTPTIELPTYTPSAIEWLVLFGVLAAVTLAWYLAARFLPIFPEDVQEAKVH